MRITVGEWVEPLPAQTQRYSNAAISANKKAAKYGCVGILTLQDVREVLDGADCHWCGKVWNPLAQIGRGPNPDTFGIDHVIPLSLGGPNTPDNLVASCHACNVSKFQADKPGRWAQKYECCIDCGKTDRPHEAHGRCFTCYWREYERTHPKRDHNYSGNATGKVTING